MEIGLLSVRRVMAPAKLLKNKLRSDFYGQSKKGFTKTELLDADAELYVPIPPKDLMREVEAFVLPFYINVQNSGLQRINIIFEYYSQVKKPGVLVMETSAQVGTFVYRKLISLEEVVDCFSDKSEKKMYSIGMFYTHFLTNDGIYHIYKEYMEEILALVTNIPNIEIEHDFESVEELLEGFTEV